MTCNECQRAINKLLDGEVTAASSSDLFDHLTKCGDCRRFFDAMALIGREMEKSQQLDEPMTALAWNAGSRKDPRHSIAGISIQRQTRQSRFRTLVVVSALILLTGLFWTTAILSRPIERTDAVQQLVQPETPNH